MLRLCLSVIMARVPHKVRFKLVEEGGAEPLSTSVTAEGPWRCRN